MYIDFWRFGYTLKSASNSIIQLAIKNKYLHNYMWVVFTRSMKGLLIKLFF